MIINKIIFLNNLQFLSYSYYYLYPIHIYQQKLYKKGKYEYIFIYNYMLNIYNFFI